MSARIQGGSIRFFRFFRMLCLAVLVLLGVASTGASALEILFGTGKSGTFSHFVGRGVSRIINQQSRDLVCKVVPASDAVYALTNLRSGSLDIALIDSRMLYDAFHQGGAFRFMDIGYKNLRSLLPLYEMPWALVVRKDAKIESLRDLKGKRINMGAPASPERMAMEALFEAKSWTRKDFGLVVELPPSQAQDTLAFCQGAVQAMGLLQVHPNASVKKLLQRCDAALIGIPPQDIEKVVTRHPAFSQMEIAGNTYPFQAERIQTFGTRGILVTSEDLDEDVVYQILKILSGNAKRLQGVHPALSPASPQDIRQNSLGIPFHPGVAKYLSEH